MRQGSMLAHYRVEELVEREDLAATVCWSLSDDGKRFLPVNTQTRAAPAFCNLVLDWPAIL